MHTKREREKTRKEKKNRKRKRAQRFYAKKGELLSNGISEKLIQKCSKDKRITTPMHAIQSFYVENGKREWATVTMTMLMVQIFDRSIYSSNNQHRWTQQMQFETTVAQRYSDARNECRTQTIRSQQMRTFPIINGRIVKLWITTKKNRKRPKNNTEHIGMHGTDFLH